MNATPTKTTLRRGGAALAAAAAALFAPALAAHAQDATATATATTPAAQTPAPTEGKKTRHQTFYLSFYTGTTKTFNSDVRLRQPGLGTDLNIFDLAWGSRPFNGSIYYGYKIGYFLPKTPRLGFELEVNHAKAYGKVGDSKRQEGTFQGQPVNETAPVSDRVQEYRVTNGINTINLNVLYRFPTFVSERYPDGKLQPYVLVGPHYYLNYAINQVNNVPNQPRGYRNNGGGGDVISVHLGAGARYFFTPHLAFETEVKYYDANAKVNIDQGTGEMKLRTVHLTGGVHYAF